MTIVTLTTDFGIGDFGAGLMPGVIWKIAPDARIVTLTHAIPPQDILAAQVILGNTFSYFPDGTVHVAVVDPGVGTQRRAIAARIGSQFFVGPDNGLITPLLEQAEANRWTVEIYHTNRPAYWLPVVSHIFHGRDIFAPVAGHLARGVPLAELGDRINDPVRASIPSPVMVESGWRGQVIQIDHFGNLSVNIQRGHLEGAGALQILINNAVIPGLSRTFGDGKPGDLIAMIDSSNRLSICVVNGSAAERLNAHPGNVVEIKLQ